MHLVNPYPKSSPPWQGKQKVHRVDHCYQYRPINEHLLARQIIWNIKVDYCSPYNLFFFLVVIKSVFLPVVKSVIELFLRNWTSEALMSRITVRESRPTRPSGNNNPVNRYHAHYIIMKLTLCIHLSAFSPSRFYSFSCFIRNYELLCQSLLTLLFTFYPYLQQPWESCSYRL